MHTIEQITREVIDVSTVVAPRRIALLMVGADLGPPTTTAGWRTIIAAAVREHRLDVEAETHYSSFALIGETIAAVGRTAAGVGGIRRRCARAVEAQGTTRITEAHRCLTILKN